MSTTTAATRYEAVASVVQVFSHPQHVDKGHAVQKVFSQGEVLPAWVDPVELDRLLTSGLIARVKGTS